MVGIPYWERDISSLNPQIGVFFFVFESDISGGGQKGTLFWNIYIYANIYIFC